MITRILELPQAQTKNWIPLNIDKIRFIVIHHIEANNASPMEINDWHLQNGWNGGFGYNEYIKKDGTVWLGRGDNIGAQCQGFNSCSYGIALEGNYNTNNSIQALQYNSLLERIRYHLSRFPKDCVVVPHRELTSTECPGNAFPFAKLLTDINVVPNDFKGVLDTLIKAGVINSSEYWEKASIPDGLLRADFVKILLTNMAKYINQHK